MTEKSKMTEMNTQTAEIRSTPERKLIDENSAQRMAARCSDYNDSRSEARNFRCAEFRDVVFQNEDLSGMDATHSAFINCRFEQCRMERIEAHFSTFTGCSFSHCDLENSNFSFATLDIQLANCDLDGVDMPFARGTVSATQCMMERATAPNANLNLKFCEVNATCFEANCSQLDLEISGSCVRRSEFNDAVVRGKISTSDLSNTELNRSDLTLLEICDSATRGMETEDSTGVDDDFEKAFEEAMSELEEEY